MKILIVAGVLCAGSLFAGLPVVSDVTMSQNPGNNHVLITYRLDRPAIVTLDIQTNGVSIGAENFSTVWGDVNKSVDKVNETCTIHWKPYTSWPGHLVTDGSAKAVISAWSKESPPDYMVIDMTAQSNILFYASEDAVPGGVTNVLYKKSKIVMKRIHAIGAVWRMCSLPKEAGRNDALEIPHDVILTNDYYIGIYPVTMMQSELGKSGTGARSIGYGTVDWEMKPANNMSYLVARGESESAKWSKSNPSHYVDTASSYYLQAIRRKTGLEIDFPTEAQWEFACRAGSDGMYNDGSDSMDAVGWNKNNWTNDAACTANALHVVGLLKPNAFGLYDMHGNVSEWCLDWVGKSLAFSDGSPAIEPSGVDQSDALDQTNRSSRGGNFKSEAVNCRSSSRGYRGWGTSDDTSGWRFCCPVSYPL